MLLKYVFLCDGINFSGIGIMCCRGRKKKEKQLPRCDYDYRSYSFLCRRMYAHAQSVFTSKKMSRWFISFGRFDFGHRRAWSTSLLKTVELKLPSAHVGGQASRRLHCRGVAPLDIVSGSYVLGWQAGMWDAKTQRTADKLVATYVSSGHQSST